MKAYFNNGAGAGKKTGAENRYGTDGPELAGHAPYFWSLNWSSTKYFADEQKKHTVAVPLPDVNVADDALGYPVDAFHHPVTREAGGGEHHHLPHAQHLLTGLEQGLHLPHPHTILQVCTQWA